MNFKNGSERLEPKQNKVEDPKLVIYNCLKVCVV